jgi:hypothetical protein|tara:strand:- start:57 stop:380 length:324 start_codon:yes stop_codon:yes gene_type:complete
MAIIAALPSFDLQTILVIIGALVLVFFPQIKKAVESLKSSTPVPEEISTDRSKAEWIVLLSELQKQTHAAGYARAEQLTCELTTELVCNCNPPPVQETVVTVTKAMI